ncbi:MAG: Do family serine endopeptidase [Candidatus Hydrogenedentota bacterium]|nr:MAG: Do family serine endopeptidase [Candidatus Hydrogenedentota bacterium]
MSETFFRFHGTILAAFPMERFRFWEGETGFLILARGPLDFIEEVDIMNGSRTRTGFLAKLLAALFVAAFLFTLAAATHYAYSAFFADPQKATAVSSAFDPALSSGTVADLQSAIVRAAEKAMPAVVAISTKSVERVRPYTSPFANDPFFRHFFGDDFFFGSPYPQDRIRQGLGSGVIVDGSGIVLTNHHVINDADEIVVTLADGREYAAETAGSDKRTDIAVLKLKDVDGTLPSAPLGNSDDLKVGMFVLAIGTPFSKTMSQTVTMGIISALGRSGLRIEEVENLIQTDAAINPGNSGGPLVNIRGEVVGINAAIITGGGQGNNGIGFAIPINTARHVYRSILKHGRVIRGYLGVSIQNLNEELRKKLGLPDPQGALVTEVKEGTPADEAELEPGDVIVEWDGQKIRNTSQLLEAVSTTEIGRKVKVVFYRDGERRSTVVTVVEHPESGKGIRSKTLGGQSEIEKLGVIVKEVEGEEAEKYDADPTGCVVVVSVNPNSLAEEVGIRPGTCILQVNRHPIRTIDDLQEALEDADSAILLLRYRGSNRFVAVTF